MVATEHADTMLHTASTLNSQSSLGIPRYGSSHSSNSQHQPQLIAGKQLVNLQESLPELHTNYAPYIAQDILRQQRLLASQQQGVVGGG